MKMTAIKIVAITVIIAYLKKVPPSKNLLVSKIKNRKLNLKKQNCKLQKVKLSETQILMQKIFPKLIVKIFYKFKIK